ncbi:MAG: primosomal protein N' [Deltaproteobacteria bacterium]|nr:primosomal protein N' [Deltaproteobacteria bacterium]
MSPSEEKTRVIYAEVALNVPLRRVFDYRLPGHLAAGPESVQPGCRVIVPFGRRVLSGIVVSLKDSSELDDARIRDVQRLTGVSPLFSGAMLRFTRWLASYYVCGWGEVLEAALPSGLGALFRTSFRAREFPWSTARLAGLPEDVREWLSERKEWTEAEWTRKASGAEARNWLKTALQPGGAVEARHEFAGTRARHLTERWVRLRENPPPEALQEARDRGRPGRETKAQRIIRALREEGDLPLARLGALMGNPGEAVRRLLEKGLVEVEERRAAPRAQPGQDTPPEDFLELNGEQALAYGQIRQALDVSGGSGGTGGSAGYRGFLLEGVTGSGKTEVYLHAVRRTLELGRTALVLVPEIALTASMVRRFRSRFGPTVAVLHSGMNEGERFEAWNEIREGRARIVIGARSAVFAPLDDLGLVVVDEEHDGSYKQDETPRYNGRDAAMMRAAQGGAVAVLGSATPSMESLRNVRLGKLELLRLEHRVEARPLPQVDMVDMRVAPRMSGLPLFSKALWQALRDNLVAGGQSILFLNRRGFATLARCGACEETLLCPHCSITLTYHHGQGRLRCHRCDHSQGSPRLCPACGHESMEHMGVGTERVEQEVQQLLPRARVLRMDSDTLRRRGELERMMDGIRQRRFDIIIGTQVLSKGHDFPHITLVGAVCADISLNIPDFRAPERTFQLLTQMAGRAGRGNIPGRVIIQTYNPRHYALSHVTAHDSVAFAAAELEIRENSASPPFSSQALVWLSSPDQPEAQALAREAAVRLREAAGELERQDGERFRVLVLGEEEAPIRRIRDRHRFMVALRSAAAGPIHRALDMAFGESGSRIKVPARARLVVDMDPYNLL